MKSLRRRFWVSAITFSIGLCCARVWPIFNRQQLISATIQAVRVPEPAAMLKVPFAEGEILETVFRYQMEHCYEGQPKTVFFLSYNRRDLPNEFFSSFTPGAVSVQQRSQRWQFLLQKRELGILINVNAIEFSQPSVVQVRCECGRGMLDGYSYSLRLMRKNNFWAVERRKLIGIS
jgi:hypothetical protein